MYDGISPFACCPFISGALPRSKPFHAFRANQKRGPAKSRASRQKWPPVLW
jgi:hypothetical protein